MAGNSPAGPPNITNCHLPILLTSLKINLFINITKTMQSDSLTSLKRVIVTHLSPKKANSFASPHTGYPLTSPKKMADSFASPNTNVYCLLTSPKKYPFKVDSNF
jgi:hypothetical protein